MGASGSLRDFLAPPASKRRRILKKLAKKLKVINLTTPSTTTTTTTTVPADNQLSKKKKAPPRLSHGSLAFLASRMMRFPTNRSINTSLNNTISESSSPPSLRTSRTRHAAREDFDVVRPLGRGSFGSVYEVKHRETGLNYAMKLLPKKRIMDGSRRGVGVGKSNQTPALLRYACSERHILASLQAPNSRHPFILPLHFAFQTSSHLALVTELGQGGTLQDLLRVRRRLREGLVRVYAAEILLALEWLHERNILFRDLKAENVLLDAHGHALLADFGLAKVVGGPSSGGETETGETESEQNEDNLARSFCGSVAYLAPEMLNRSGHGRTLDLYGLGVLCFELFVGKPPFYHPNKQQLFLNIQKKTLQVPSVVPEAGADFIQQLMRRVPMERLGARKTNDVREHRFFEGLSFDLIFSRKFVPLPGMLEIREQLRSGGGGAPPDPFLSSEGGFAKVPYWDFSYPRPATVNMEFID